VSSKTVQALLVLGLIAALLFGFFMLSQRQSAINERNFAVAAVANAELQRDAAATQAIAASTRQANAENDRATALAQVSTANAAQAAAEENQKTAVAQANQAATVLVDAAASQETAVAQAQATLLATLVLQPDAGDGAALVPPSATVQNSPVTLELSPVVVANHVDRNGCAIDETSVVSPDTSSFYVVTRGNIPRGTTVFVRLYRDNQPIEDLPMITADQDYRDTCVPFVFQVDDATSFDSGGYRAEYIINGNRANAIDFTIR
jgi:hypothetical protein